MDRELDETIRDQDTNFERIATSDNEYDDADVVVRHPGRSSRYLLADEGDGAEADQLGTTPPRSRIRVKAIRKRDIDTAHVARSLKAKRNSSDHLKVEPTSPGLERPKRAGLKLYRSRERDWKQEMSQRETMPDSLPSPGVTPAVPTLVESCSRFMCLTSRLKSRESSTDAPPEDEVEPRHRPEPEDMPASRVNFHKTFSMLINMGNIEKGCRRTISREEQVWQNELKDLIWLELQAKIAGRTLAQQDAFLCAQRDIVPTIVQNIIDYRFVNPNPCRSRTQTLSTVAGSREDLNGEPEVKEESNECDNEDETECLSFNCRACADAIGKAMREVGTLLDSFYNAVALYPSSKAMTVGHPLIATQLFKNRLKAMCLWYNTALHMRLKMLSVRRIMRTMRLKRHRSPRPSVDSTLSRQSSEHERARVRFAATNNNPTDSSNSDCSTLSDSKKEGDDAAGPDGEDKEDRPADEADGVPNTDYAEHNGQSTPEIVVSDSRYGTADTSASSESGYASSGGAGVGAGAGAGDDAAGDVYSLGALDDITRLRLLGKCHVSPYREYHCEMLKTQGVRRCMMFINKMRKSVLHKVYMSLEKPDCVPADNYPEEVTVEVFDDTKDEEEKTDQPHDEELETYQLKRYGSWSEESLAMRLPSYRSHFLVLSSICMEAVHDYLALRLEARPARPSCLTVKQLIHELKEGLDISTEMRRDFVRNVEVALKDRHMCAPARQELLLLLNTYDDTVETVLKQYLSYLTTMSETEYMPRACVQAEWTFTARLAKRVRCAAVLAPRTFSEISCNQITRLMKEFKKKFDGLVELETKVESSPNRYTAYEMCRAVQDIYACWREPLLHAAQWARALAARLARAQPPLFRPQREAIFNKLMSMREFIVKHTDMVLERTRVPDEELELTEGLVTRVRELLLQMFKLGFEVHKELHRVVNVAARGARARRARSASGRGAWRAR